MNSKTTALLIKDYGKAVQTLCNILRREQDNRIVLYPDYLTPTIVLENVPLFHSDGEFQYFKRIRNTIETAIVAGCVQPSELPHGAPKYLSDLVR